MKFIAMFYLIIGNAKTYAEFHSIDLHDLKQMIVAIKSLTMF